MDSRSTFESPARVWNSRDVVESFLVLLLFFVVAGNPPPAVNEAHYLIKARHYWNPEFLASDSFVTSGNAHLFFYWALGWLTKFCSLPTLAWIGRLLGWALIASGLVRLVRQISGAPFAAVIVAAVWVAGVREANLAGEWVIGGIEGKVFAYGLVVWGWNAILRGMPSRGWVLLGLASAFHVLVGGWCVVATLGVRGVPGIRSSLFPPWKIREIFGLLAGGAISLLGVIPGLGLGAVNDPQASDWAAQIQVYGRLTHHLNPASFPLSWFAMHGGLVGIMMFLAHRVCASKQAESESGNLFGLRAMVRIGHVAFAITCIGLVMGVLPALDRQLGANILRFYWFRLGDAIVPLVVGLLVVHWLFNSRQTLSPSGKNRFGVACVLVLVTCYVLGRDYLRDQQNSMPEAISQGNLLVRNVEESQSDDSLAIAESQLDGQRNDDVYTEWLSVCDWVRSSTPMDAVFITPRHQQTFKWYAERAEVVNWKDIPQDAKSIVDWGRRLNRVFPIELGRRHPPSDSSSLAKLSNDYRASFIIIDRRWLREIAGFPRVYPAIAASNQTYWVYQLPGSTVPTPAID